MEKQSTVVKPEYHLDTSEAGDNEGFTPVLTRHNRRKKSQTLSRPPTPDRKLPSSQIPTQTRKTVSSLTKEIPLPAEIRIMDHNANEYPRMEEPLNLPVQLDTLTEILQERLQEMTNQIDRRAEQKLLDKI